MLKVTLSPHIKSEDTNCGIMLDVIIALLPSTIAGFLLFGFSAVLVVAVSVAAAVAAEYLWCIARKKPTTIRDLTAILTGLLFGLILPPSLPIWMVALGSAFSVVVVKGMVGGLLNFFINPAITARVVLLLIFYSAMNNFIHPFTDSVSSATPLSSASVTGYAELFLGDYAGCIGETSSLLLIAGGVYLIVRKVISWHIPVTFIGAFAILTLIFGENPLIAILSGGILFGAIFMATDYITSPPTWLGKIIFGLGCGVLTFVIRKFTFLSEGVSFAILIMNILAPYITKFTSPKPFGAEK